MTRREMFATLATAVLAPWRRGAHVRAAGPVLEDFGGAAWSVHPVATARPTACGRCHDLMVVDTGPHPFVRPTVPGEHYWFGRLICDPCAVSMAPLDFAWLQDRRAWLASRPATRRGEAISR